MGDSKYLFPALTETLISSHRDLSSQEVLEKFPSYSQLRELGWGWEADLLRSRYRDAAQFVATKAVEEGRLTRPQTCEECGGHPEDGAVIEMHHPNYDEPLNVEWLCRPCHLHADIKRRMNRPVASQGSSQVVRYLRAREAAEYLGLRVQTIYNRVWRDAIPHHGSGTLLRFKKSELDEWLADQDSNGGDS